MSSQPNVVKDSSFAPVNSFKKIWRGELLSGFQVFLIALPLCLGIAMASGFPAVAGLVTAIVGGLVVSRISGSHVTINGPAAGLIVVILGGVELLGHGDPVLGYKLTLAAIVCAGVLQMVCGFLRIGKLASFFPVAVVHGMLTAIGIIIIAKQFPVMLGAKPQAQSILGLIVAIPGTIMDANPLVGAIGVVSLVVLSLYKLAPDKMRKTLPGPIIVVIFGAVMAKVTGLGTGSGYEVLGQAFDRGPNFLVALPGHVFSELALPDFSHFYSWDFALVVFSISIIAGIESLLSASAIDKLDPMQRKTDLNRDIFAVGLGTTLSALLGGLPMIAEIVRSSANVSAGAKSQWSNFFHGLFLLVAILALPNLIRMIPLSTLAALLVFTGIRLASPLEFRKMKAIGLDQFVLFVVTCVSVLATDLLVGVAIGVAVKIAMHLLRRVPIRTLIRCQYKLERHGDGHHISVTSAVVFTNLISIAGVLEQVSKSSRTTVDLTSASFVDHTTMEFLHSLGKEFATAGGNLTIVESDFHVRATEHPLAARSLKPQSSI